MITNLFSTFDPSTGLFSLNWLSSLILLLFMPMRFWYIPSRYIIFISKILNTISFELNLLINSRSLGRSLLFCSLFIFILFNNFLGLFPYIFTRSRHLVFSLSLSLPLWLTFVLFGFLNNTNHIFCHLVPIGTPAILIPFIVCIETVRNLIRPGSLAVRLTANIIAGHLLITLLGKRSINSEIYMNIIILIQILLILFESAVCVIQSYVFTVLRTLYYREVS